MQTPRPTFTFINRGRAGAACGSGQRAPPQAGAVSLARRPSPRRAHYRPRFTNVNAAAPFAFVKFTYLNIPPAVRVCKFTFVAGVYDCEAR